MCLHLSTTSKDESCTTAGQQPDSGGASSTDRLSMGATGSTLHGRRWTPCATRAGCVAHGAFVSHVRWVLSEGWGKGSRVQVRSEPCVLPIPATHGPHKSGTHARGLGRVRARHGSVPTRNRGLIPRPGLPLASPGRSLRAGSHWATPHPWSGGAPWRQKPPAATVACACHRGRRPPCSTQRWLIHTGGDRGAKARRNHRCQQVQTPRP